MEALTNPRIPLRELVEPVLPVLERGRIWKAQFIGDDTIVIQSKNPDKTIERPRITAFVDAIERLPEVKRAVTFTDDRIYRITVEYK